jgi:hypothetical protein
MEEVLRVVAGTSSDGTPAFEEVLVEACGAGQYRLLRSPGLVLGMAAEDTFMLNPDGSCRVISRGRNLCIQVLATARLDELEREATPRLLRLGGRLDGKTSEELVYTVPVEAGFSAIERVLREVIGKHLAAEWYYGNVYDPEDGVTPLNWWLESR